MGVVLRDSTGKAYDLDFKSVERLIGVPSATFDYDPNTAHPFTKRSYCLRSHVVCDECNRRARGKFLRGTVYYVCEPAKGYVPAGHPQSYWIREDQLITGIGDFFTNHIFSPNRCGGVVGRFTRGGAGAGRIAR